MAFIPVFSFSNSRSSRPVVLCSILFLSGGEVALSGDAQNSFPSAAPVTSAISPYPFDLKKAQNEAEKLFMKGAYDDTISKTTQALEGAKGDQRLHYFRGRAAMVIGSYELARRDFKLLGDFKPYEKWRAASEFVVKIDKVMALIPLNTRELRDAEGEVVFRVHYDQEDEWSKSILDLLPQAYRINRTLLGRDMKETPVFIFNDPDRFRRFLTLRCDWTPVAWIWAFGNIDGLYFCQNTSVANSKNPLSPNVQGSVAHEFNHCLVAHVTGNMMLPVWFTEGLAETTEPGVAPERGRDLTQRLAIALRAHALLPLSIISDRASYNEAVTNLLSKQSQGDAYAQSFSMAIFFLSLVPPEKLTPFLEAVRDSHDFDKTLEGFTGKTPDEFFEAWQAQAQAK